MTRLSSAVSSKMLPMRYVINLIERMATKLKPKRVKVDNSVKLAKTDAAIKRWQTKAKRAATALRKLTAKRKRILRTMETPTT